MKNNSQKPPWLEAYEHLMEEAKKRAEKRVHGLTRKNALERPPKGAARPRGRPHKSRVKPREEAVG